MGTAACAVTIAASTVSMTPAHADPIVSPSLALLGNSSEIYLVPGQPGDNDKPDPGSFGQSLVSAAAAPAATRPGLPFYFGPSDPTAPPRTTVFSVTLIPGFLQPFFGWFSQLNFEVCIGGLSGKLGPYGTISVGVSQGC